MDDEIAEFRLAIELHELEGANEDLAVVDEKLAAAQEQAASTLRDLADLD